MTAESASRQDGVLRQTLSWATRFGLGRRLAYVLAGSAIVSGLITYVALTSSTPLGPDPRTVFLLLNIDLVLLLALGAVIARKVALMWGERRRGIAGARLQTRLVALFSLIAVTPAIILAVFSTLFFNFGIQAWFSERVQTALSESLAVTEAYLDEHQQNIRADVLAIADDLEHDWSLLLNNPNLLTKFLATQAAIRGLPEAVVFDRFGRVMASSGFTFSLQIENLPQWALERARGGEIPILTNEDGDRVRALVLVDSLAEIYLYVGRFVDPSVLLHVSRTEQAVEAYQKLEGQHSGLQITFALIFGIVALLLLMASVWVGLTFATRLSSPIIGLITAAEKVREGDLSVRVPEGPEGDEFGTLGRAFNRMTERLLSQQRELMTASEQIDDRRRFTEAVLSGVSAGVIGLDARGRIDLPNRSACNLLNTRAEDLFGKPIGKAVPEMAHLFSAVRRSPSRLAEAQIQIDRGGRRCTLLVRIGAEREGGQVRGYVATFDDISALLSAQRKAAWADVARRIAHEIRNPLTPIQLSAERLKRKYADEITTDPDVFKTCTDTIIRQVEDIGRMVEEFSSFAKMPAPVMKDENVTELVRQQVFLQRNAHPEVTYAFNLPDTPVTLRCDGRQVSQALTNLLQNAAEAIMERGTANDMARQINVLLDDGDEAIVIAVEDNGRGLPSELKGQLTEPYVTTRDKGTGLGLAIVKKIMEDHSGDLVIEDRPGGGARVALVFRVSDDGEQQPNDRRSAAV
ncbi:MAG: PAS domain-containing sensor histidine kinase [Alphaproteobacteria bacterium]|nr:PAS domain-containing sensor histidine kinase [Alphaproteobacteria bacterium]